MARSWPLCYLYVKPVLIPRLLHLYCVLVFSFLSRKLIFKIWITTLQISKHLPNLFPHKYHLYRIAIICVCVVHHMNKKINIRQIIYMITSRNNENVSSSLWLSILRQLGYFPSGLLSVVWLDFAKAYHVAVIWGQA